MHTPIFTYLVSENKPNFNLLALQTVEKYLPMSELFRNHVINEKTYAINVLSSARDFLRMVYIHSLCVFWSYL